MKVSKRETINRYYLVKLFGFGLFVHKIHHSDPEDIFHTHPWNAISFIFGSYKEHRLDGSLKEKIGLNIIKATTPHRVELHKGSVWTIFVHGRRYNQWKVFDVVGKVIDEEPWRGVDGRKTYLP